MHIINKIFWFRAGLMVSIALAITAGILFVSGTGTVAEATRLSRQTNRVLNQIAATQQLHKDADHAGRLAMNGENHLHTLPGLRAQVFAAVDHLEQLLSDNAVQLENCSNLRAAILERYQIQDEQIASVNRENGKMTFVATTARESGNALFRVESAFDKTRLTELILLHEREEIRTRSQWRIVYSMAFAFSLFVLIAVGNQMAVLHELKIRKQSRDEFSKIAGSTSIDPGYAVMIDSDKYNRIMRLLDEGEPHVSMIGRSG